MQVQRSKNNLIESQFLLTAYCHGYFPMADPKTGDINWYSPDPRTIFDLENFHIPRSLRTIVKRQLYDIKIDQQFEAVIRGCAERRETWISEAIIQSYLTLHSQGFAHSVETWKNGTLVGGLYGVAIRGAFFGESMFSKMKDASKVALVELVNRLRKQGFHLLDTQYSTPHLQLFGAIEIPRDEYLVRLKNALEQTCTFTNEEL
jgi:leucyl/phenylalanyl-tRNA--protein transferase